MQTLILAAVPLAIVFLLGCIGETFTEKVGHLNLGIPGIMCLGAAGGAFGCAIAGNLNPILDVIVAIIFGGLFAALGGLIYAFLTVTLRCNQNVTGLSLTTFGTGFAAFLVDQIIGNIDFEIAIDNAAMYSFPNTFINIDDKTPFIKQLLLGQSIYVYIGLIIAVVSAIILFYTRIGMNLRAVGESPSAADSAGINVTGYKYSFILIGSAIAGIGGLGFPFLITNSVGAELVITVEGLGWLCVALVILSMWNPIISIATSFIFSMAFISRFYTLQLPFLAVMPIAFWRAFPYVVSIIVLIITSMFGKKENQAPAALGLSYFREDR